MYRWGEYEFRFAATSAEFTQIHKLNYRTFVREIPQHKDNGSGELVDKFHDKSRYLIAVKDDRVLGMISAHSQPPFSMAERLPDASILIESNVRPIEIRLLAVEPELRHTPLLLRLVWELYQHAKAEGFTHFVISGVLEQQQLYEHLGFVALGPPVGATAKFVPMWLPMGQLETRMGRVMERLRQRMDRPTMTAERTVTAKQNGSHSTTTTAVLERPKTSARRKMQDSPICLLPGPVALAPAVLAAFREPILYHRADDFLPLYESVRERLSGMVGGKPVALFVGSGTLGNDAVAATINADPARENGLVLVSGEFGGRLLRQAQRWNLNPRVCEWGWGKAWDLADIEAVLKTMPQGGWIWGTHHETSTGVLNDLPGLLKLAKKYGQRVCVDCVSSLATVPVDLSDAWLATGASGKAIGSYAGIAFVFADPKSLTHLDSSKLPTYLDINAALTTDGPRFTVPSPLINSLHKALEVFATPESRAARLQQVAEVGAFVRKGLEAAGYTILAPAEIANPSIVTFAPPEGLTTADFVEQCRTWGYQIAGQSGYLADRRYVQIAVMGDVTVNDVEPLLDRLAQ